MAALVNSLLCMGLVLHILLNIPPFLWFEPILDNNVTIYGENYDDKHHEKRAEDYEPLGSL